jgi:glycosyltransferase involved in cell wall biosynthesis
MTVTPVILTFDEGSNIETTLASLKWAPRVVVLDSGSTDQTEQIARSFDNVSWFVRGFDNHRAQWLFAIHETSIATDYVLALDADMRPGVGFQDELQAFLKRGELAGAWIPFEYRVLGRGLMGSIYPAQIRLFRRSQVRISQPGHSQAFEVIGSVCRFRSQLIHEDLKPVSRWLSNQVNYASLEAARIKCAPNRSFKDWLRVVGISPAIWGIYAYLRAGGPLRSAASRAYACERLIFEAILARMLSEQESRMSKEGESSMLRKEEESSAAIAGTKTNV